MNPGRILRTGITASAIAHLSVLMLVLFFTEVHPFGSVTAEPITVDIVSPAEAPPPPNKEEPLPEPKGRSLPTPSTCLRCRTAAASVAASPPPAAPQPAASAAAAAGGAVGAFSRARHRLTPGRNRQRPAPQRRPTSLREPDLSVKYHVMLGLPPDLPAEPPKGKPGDDFDAPASKTADLDIEPRSPSFDVICKTCSKLPASIAPSDKRHDQAAGVHDARRASSPPTRS